MSGVGAITRVDGLYPELTGLKDFDDRRITKMTKEQKIEWLAKADAETLLNQYEAAVRRADKA